MTAASVGALATSLLVIASPSGAASPSGSITYGVHPVMVPMAGYTAKSGFPTPGNCVKYDGLACYTPQVLHTAYQIPWQINGQWAGTGQSVAIIDAYGSPTIASDLATFSAAFGLPAATLNIVYPGGKPTVNPLKNATQNGWASETSLDVETVHSLAPGATINLVIAASPAGNVLNNAQAYAVSNHLGDVMSMSYGAPEAAIAGGGNNLQVQQAEATFAAAQAAGISVFASSGDNGAGNGYSTPNALFPASSPLVTATGGTALFVNADKSPRSTNYNYSGEWTWNSTDPATCPFGCDYGPFGATGGAPSSIFAAPSFQAGLNGMRTTSDVSFNAAVYTGTMIYLGFLGANNNGFYFFGGTSEAAPSWAAITTDIDQARGGSDLGYLNPALYSAPSSDFHDVTVGNNSLVVSSTVTLPGFNAGEGYDLPTGLGTPIVSSLMGTLASGYSYTTSMTQP